MLDNFFHAHIISLTKKKKNQPIYTLIGFNSIKLDVLYIIEQSLNTKLVVT